MLSTLCQTLLCILILLFSSVSYTKTLAIPNHKFDQDQYRTLIRTYLFDHYKDQKGVPIESVLSALGALSGYAVQQGLREKLIKQQGLAEQNVFTMVQTDNGSRYYYGEVFDKPMFSTEAGHASVWSIVASGAFKAGAKAYPDIHKMAAVNAKRLGTKAYGRIDVAVNHQPKDSPQVALKKHWKLTEKIIRAKQSEPMAWSWELAMIAQDLIVLHKDILQPEIALQIFMQSAISMSKIDPAIIQPQTARVTK